MAENYTVGMFRAAPKILAAEMRKPGPNMLLGGLGFAFLVCGVGSAIKTSDDFLKNDSVYARRYIKKYRVYNEEKAAAEGAAHH